MKNYDSSFSSSFPFSVVAICITNEKVEVENVGSVRKELENFHKLHKLQLQEEAQQQQQQSTLGQPDGK